MPPRNDVAQAARRAPYGASDEHRFQIELALKERRDWVFGGPWYKPLVLRAVGVDSTRKSVVIHALTDLARKLLGPPEGGYGLRANRRRCVPGGWGRGPHPHQFPTGGMEFGQIDPAKGESM